MQVSVPPSTPLIHSIEEVEDEDTYQQALATYTNCAVYTVVPYEPLGSQEEFHHYASVLTLAKRLKAVVDVQGPVHIDEAFRAVAKCWGFNTLGKKIKRQLSKALAAIDASERPTQRGELWLWPHDRDPEKWQEFRIPNDDARSIRKVEHIPPEEVAIASRAVLKRAIGSMKREDLARATAHLFGIRRMGSKVSEHIDEGIELMGTSCETRGEELRWIG